jgi:hypothetical protein
MWNYFIESDKTSPIAGAQVGTCADALKLKVVSGLADGEWSITLCSHSTHLNGEKEIFFEFTHPSAFTIPLGQLEDSVNVIKVGIRKGDVLHECWVALTPVKEYPKVCIVVGSPRSGTTVVGNMIQQAYQVKAHGEAHLAELFSKLIEQTSQYITSGPAALNKGTLVWEMPAILLKAQLIKQLRDLYITYYGTTAIVDKTPGIPMLQALPLLLLAFPNAKVVYCQRRGIENVASRIRKFPKVKFEGHCRQWAQAVKVWQRTKKAISAMLTREDWFIEVEQFNLATSPKNVTQTIGDFLGTNDASINRMFNYQAEKSPQVTGGKPSDITSIERLNWAEEQKAFFISHCGTLMSDLGYSFDESYFKKEAH